MVSENAEVSEKTYFLLYQIPHMQMIIYRSAMPSCALYAGLTEGHMVCS